MCRRPTLHLGRGSSLTDGSSELRERKGRVRCHGKSRPKGRPGRKAKAGRGRGGQDGTPAELLLRGWESEEGSGCGWAALWEAGGHAERRVPQRSNSSLSWEMSYKYLASPRTEGVKRESSAWG